MAGNEFLCRSKRLVAIEGNQPRTSTALPEGCLIHVPVFEINLLRRGLHDTSKCSGSILSLLTLGWNILLNDGIKRLGF